MVTELIVCPRCGASPSAPADAQGQYVCGYCGARYLTRQPVARPVHVSPPVHAPPPLRPTPIKQTSPAAVALAVMGGLVVLGVVGGAGALLTRDATPDAAGGGSPARPTPAKNATLLLAPTAAAPDVPATATFAAESNVSGYQKSFYVLGFVTNTSPFTIDKPKVTAVLLDKAGKEVATRDGYAESDALASHQTAPIKLLVSDPPAYDSIKFEIIAKKASYIAEEATGLRLEIGEAPHQTFGTSWEVTGKVFNDGKQAARFVQIQVLAFNAAGKLVGLDSTYVDGEAVAPGASGRFRAIPLYDAAPHHFKFAVSGRPAK